MPDPPRPDPPAHVLRCAVTWGSDTLRGANVMWVRDEGTATPSGTEIADFADSFHALVAEHFVPCVSDAWALLGVKVNYFGGDGLQLEGNHAETVTGTRGSGGLPAQVAAGISWHVQQAYRGGHPRTALPGPIITDVAAPSLWTTDFQTFLRAAANAFHTDVNDMTDSPFTGLHLGTVSFVLDGEWRTPPVFRDFTPGAAQVDRRIDTQRRRLGPDL